MSLVWNLESNCEIVEIESLHKLSKPETFVCKGVNTNVAKIIEPNEEQIIRESSD